jgi:hypothetical protein
MGTMFRGIPGQRKAANEAAHAQGNNASPERQTDPLQDIGHLHLPFHWNWSRQKADWFIIEGGRWPGS